MSKNRFEFAQRSGRVSMKIFMLNKLMVTIDPQISFAVLGLVFTRTQA